MIRRFVPSRAARAAALLALAAAAACAPATPSPVGPQPQPQPGPPAVTYAAFPGFDTGIYPGDAAMRAWRQSSPYVWVGYYLAAPCHRDLSWSGKRDALIGMGWGTAVIYLGQQDWAAMPSRIPAARDTVRRDSTRDTTAVPLPQPTATTTAPPASAPTASSTTPAQPGACSAANLTAVRGGTDAADAANRAAAEGFPPGTVIYLDVERVQTVSLMLADYVRGWMDGVLADGRYVPGLYVHRLNADALADAARSAYVARGRSESPPLWVTSSAGFSLQQTPSGAGVPSAGIWQGLLDTHESWGGYPLTIDQNVAAARSPSAPR